MAIIGINGMEFYAYHGCFAEEQAIGTHFRADVQVYTDTTRAQQSDSIEDTVNYLSVYQTVRREMMIPSHLLEHVADRIANALLREFAPIAKVMVRIYKCNPPLGGQMESVSVEIEKSRDNTLGL